MAVTRIIVNDSIWRTGAIKLDEPLYGSYRLNQRLPFSISLGPELGSRIIFLRESEFAPVYI